MLALSLLASTMFHPFTPMKTVATQCLLQVRHNDTGMVCRFFQPCRARYEWERLKEVVLNFGDTDIVLRQLSVPIGENATGPCLSAQVTNLTTWQACPSPGVFWERGSVGQDFRGPGLDWQDMGFPRTTPNQSRSPSGLSSASATEGSSQPENQVHTDVQSTGSPIAIHTLLLTSRKITTGDLHAPIPQAQSAIQLVSARVSLRSFAQSSKHTWIVMLTEQEIMMLNSATSKVELTERAEKIRRSILHAFPEKSKHRPALLHALEDKVSQCSGGLPEMSLRALKKIEDEIASAASVADHESRVRHHLHHVPHSTEVRHAVQRGETRWREKDALAKREELMKAEAIKREQMEELEFAQLVEEVTSLGFTESRQITKYIIDQKLGRKYKHISGVLEMERDGYGWLYRGGFPPHIYAKRCSALDLAQNDSGARVQSFMPFRDAENPPEPRARAIKQHPST